jgi:hypothetical protein
MSDIHDHKLEAMLRTRRVEPVSPELAERIILKAQGRPQNRTIPLRQWVQRLFAEFHLPQPAYVLACALMIGFIVGLTMPVPHTAEDAAETLQVQSFLYVGEDIL